MVSRQVRLGAVNPVAWISVGSIVIVKATEPHGADICSKRPFSDPDIVLNSTEMSVTVGVTIAVGLNALRAPPGLIEMGVHDDVLHIVVRE